MRLGECLAARWSDVDLDAGVIRVNRSVEWSDRGQFAFVPPKTSRGRRTVHLPPFAVSWLRQHRREQNERRLLLGAAWSEYDLILDVGDGRPLRSDSVSAAFRRVMREAAIPGPPRFHDLRHAYATVSLIAGVHPKVVSEALGHSTVSLTLDRYSHVVPSLGEQAALAIEAVLGPSARP